MGYESFDPEDPSPDLQTMLEENYFAHGKKRPQFSREEIGRAGKLIRRVLRFDPASRVSAEEALKDEWFKGLEDDVGETDLGGA